MRLSTFLPILAASLATAAPLEQRDTVEDYNAPPGGDVTILNYALTLEYLERKFYMEGLANYTQADFVAAGFADPFYDNLKEIYYDEQACFTLAGALGTAAVHEATYSFPSTDVKSFLALSSVLEGVGVSAYLGAAAEIVTGAYLTVAGSILTVESRHSSYIRAALKESPFPKPFDTPLDFNQVFSLAAQFITSFAPGDPALPFKAFPALTIQPSQYPYTAGSSPVTFTHAMKNAVSAGLIKADTPVYAVFFSGLDTYYVKVRTTSGNSGDFKIDMIPAGGNGQLAPTGQVYVVLSTADGTTTKVSDENTISGVGILEVNPVGQRDGVF
ncbi:related to stress response protein rds1p [Phialocephala subalpina]|uniref:Related to stress response protein rds1p n=1 Tax=Phialocephala subalpina TaxID=576137 RepID=A0A1L7WFF3_9HELO|nr:related to stress response protein rds1p [Phialocephala subalpina]